MDQLFALHWHTLDADFTVLVKSMCADTLLADCYARHGNLRATTAVVVPYAVIGDMLDLMRVAADDIVDVRALSVPKSTLGDVFLRVRISSHAVSEND